MDAVRRVCFSGQESADVIKKELDRSRALFLTE